MWSIQLRIPEDSVNTLDPTVVLCRLRVRFPETIVCLYDYARKDVELFRAVDGAQSAAETAERDAQRRGPGWVFRVYWQSIPVGGSVERRRLRLFRNDAPLPNDLQDAFREFAHSLVAEDPFIEVHGALAPDRE